VQLRLQRFQFVYACGLRLEFTGKLKRDHHSNAASREPTRRDYRYFLNLWFAKTLADFEINDIAVLPSQLWYNS
jgi:hypothetical protein